MSVQSQPSPSYSITIRLEIQNRIGAFARVAAAISEHGGMLGAVDIVKPGREKMVRDVTVHCRDEAHAKEILKTVRQLDGIHVRSWSDNTFLLHLGGKLRIESKIPLDTRDALSRAYTPGVARVCRAIADDPRKVFNLTIKQHTVAIVSDGTAVLGLGDIGPEAALPVMEGKAQLFKEFGNVDAFPLCLNTQDSDEIVETVKRVAPAFGGINLEDISAPRCFDIEQRLRNELDIPVFHDDQHGTAVVVLAALINALRVVDKDFDQLNVAMIGAGAAGIACAKILMSAGVRHIIGCDRTGILYKGRTENMNFMKEWFAENTNEEGRQGTLSDAIAGADVFLGLSAPGVLTVDDVQRMADKPIVFAMANPDPEIRPEEVEGVAHIIATGRSDYPNQINNVLCFPGLFRGALDAHATTINEEMKIAAAHAIADFITPDERMPEYIIPSVFSKKVFRDVARAVKQAAINTGVARRE